jgi:uncharacterized protein
MTKPVKIVLIVLMLLAPLGFVVGYGLAGKMESKSDSAAGTTVVDWRLLRELDYKTGVKSEKVAAIDGKTIKIPGFVVPLDDNAGGSLTEFLLVPSPQACIHVPAPPPNQMVFVRMKSGAAPKRSYGPVWVYGTLMVMTTNSGYGEVSYTLTADKTEPYKTEF